MTPNGPGRFTRAAIHCEAGEVEARLSAKGNWELRIRGADEDEWRLICSGDLQGGTIAPLAEPELPLRLGPLTFDRAARRVFVGETEVRLSNREFDLLRVLTAQPNRVVLKAEVYESWGYPAGTRSRTLEGHASRLRCKLRRAGAEGLVVNHHSIGYKLWEGASLTAAERRAA